MNRFILADATRCIGCKTCMAGCSTVHKARGFQALPRLNVVRTEGLTAPIVCRHCENAPCIKSCPVGAISTNGDRVYLNEATCIGCRLCAIACPFGAITPSGTVVEESSFVTQEDQPSTDGIAETIIAVASVKCDLCGQRKTGPECVRVCPTKALSVVNTEAFSTSIENKRLAALTGQDNFYPFTAHEQEPSPAPSAPADTQAASHS